MANYVCRDTGVGGRAAEVERCVIPASHVNIDIHNSSTVTLDNNRYNG